MTVDGPVTAAQLTLDNRDLGPADSQPLILAPPGVHRIRLIDLSGKVVDQVLFTMR